MKCPRCDQSLKEVGSKGIKVDTCNNGCCGIWFDAYELKRMDEPHEPVEDLIFSIKPKPGIKLKTGKIRCPRCVDTIYLMRHFFSVKQDVEVDHCAGCGGYWLDFGELHRIRAEYKTETEREQAAKNYFSKLFDESMKQVKTVEEAKLKEAQEVASLFKFLCPSYYIPGKQKGGAF